MGTGGERRRKQKLVIKIKYGPDPTQPRNTLGKHNKFKEHNNLHNQIIP